MRLRLFTVAAFLLAAATASRASLIDYSVEDTFSFPVGATIDGSFVYDTQTDLAVSGSLTLSGFPDGDGTYTSVTNTNSSINFTEGIYEINIFNNASTGDASYTTQVGFNGGTLEDVFEDTTTITTASAGNPSVTPEPASLALLGTGMVGLLGFARRRFA